MPRGGKRPGAGAPLGNLNALKQGHRSRILSAAVEQIAQNSTLAKAFARVMLNPQAQQQLEQKLERVRGKQQARRAEAKIRIQQSQKLRSKLPK